MNPTIEYLERCKAALGIETDYKLAQKLGVAPQYVYNWRAGKTFSDGIAIKVAEILEIDPLSVLLAQCAQRTKCPAAGRIFRTAAAKLDPFPNNHLDNQPSPAET